MNPFVQDEDFALYCGDVREVLRTLQAESVHCVVTSPPYWGLRDYGTGLWEGGDRDCDHIVLQSNKKTPELSAGTLSLMEQQKKVTVYATTCGKCGARRIDQQLGLEPTPDEYVANMVAVFREVRRVLRRDGTCWLNIGDSYNANGREGHGTRIGAKQGTNRASAEGLDTNRPTAPSLKPKDLVGIPWRLAFALQADGWYLRSDIIWSKPNPMPESVTDRPTKAHEYVFLLTRSPRYFFDQEAVREPVSPSSDFRPRPDHATAYSMNRGVNSEGTTERLGNGSRGDPSGRNVRSVWEIATQPYAEAHFATFPEALVERCVKAGTSERGCCPECGAPWERETERTAMVINRSERTHALGHTRSSGTMIEPPTSKTTGWRPTCDHGQVDLRLIQTPTGERAGDDPTCQTGRAGMNRPRGDNEGRRPITRYEQSEYAAALRASPARGEMQAEAGEAFAHYIRTDESGARPVPADLLERWIGNGWVERVEIPEASPPEPVPCVVLDPFMGSGTTALVARRLGRRSVGVELNADYCALAARRLQQLSLLA